MPQFPNPNNSTGVWTLEKQRNADMGSNWGSPLIVTSGVVPYLIDVYGTKYWVYRFVVDSNTTSKTFTMDVSSGTAVAEFLVVAGGGSGAGYVGGGGGGGGFIEGSFNISTGTYTIVVGGGSGPGLTSGNARGPVGKDSSISGPNLSITAYGGGAGGNHDSNAGSAGGSGGGGASTNGQTSLGGGVTAGVSSGSALISAASYGFRGGNTTGGRGGNDCEGAGGGGAGGQGLDHSGDKRRAPITALRR